MPSGPNAGRCSPSPEHDYARETEQRSGAYDLDARALLVSPSSELSSPSHRFEVGQRWASAGRVLGRGAPVPPPDPGADLRLASPPFEVITIAQCMVVYL